MLVTIEEFRSRVNSDCHGLIAELQALTGRYGTDEARAWESSLQKLSTVFQAPSFQPLHLYFGARGNLALEYQLPASGSWCDVVLLGAHRDQPAAVILELKDWITRGDKPGRYEGLVERQGAQVLHPSDQVRGYVEYCRRFHSTVAERRADVHGCVLFTADRWAGAYAQAPNEELARRYPLFTIAPADVSEHFPEFFKGRLSVPDELFAKSFVDGRYRQDRGFVAQIGQQILDPGAKVFELLDNQRAAFALCRAIVRETIASSSNAAVPKRVVIINGPPGSGKSVIAARLWASLVTDKEVPSGDVVFTTTSLSQNSNWADLFKRTTGVEGASGVVRKATTYTPVTTHRVGLLRQQHGDAFLENATEWRRNLETLQALGEPYRDGSLDNQNLVSIVDEAHALINPEHPRGRGQFGFAATLGPQGYHIIRSSVISVFLLDPLQGFRERENTSIEDLRRWSRELGAGDPTEIGLEGMQFRCAGSAEYVEWIESLLRGTDPQTNAAIAKRWQHRVGTGSDASRVFVQLSAAEAPATYAVTSSVPNSANRATFDFRVFDNPESWEALLREKSSQGASVRILSTYSRKWKTEKAANPHALPPSSMDFHEPYVSGGKTRHWSRIWNFVPNGSDYTWFVTGHSAGHIAEDPLCEVGCPYAVRGFDYDYVGILWLNDLVWRGGRWQVDPNAVEERGIKDLTASALRESKRGQEGKASAELFERVAQAYRILFTRALKGAYVWVPESGTREHVLASLGPA
jgi:hypothetical protein